MRQNKHSLLAFPAFNNTVSILHREAIALLELFFHQANLVGWSCDKDNTFGLAYGLFHMT